MDLGMMKDTLLEDLTAASERRWGPARTRELATALQARAETLTLVGSVDLGIEDLDPDFIR
jgi:hypothetical protein